MAEGSGNTSPGRQGPLGLKEPHKDEAGSWGSAIPFVRFFPLELQTTVASAASPLSGRSHLGIP